MTRTTQNRTKAKWVAGVNLFFAGAILIGLGVWLYFKLHTIRDLSTYLQSREGIKLIVVSIVIVACVCLEIGLGCLLIFAVKENSFTKCKIWFFVQTVFLAAVTLGFLVDLTSPTVPVLVPIFFIIFYKSVSLWVVSRLVDEMKIESQQGRLIPPFASTNSNDGSREDPYYQHHDHN